MAMFLCLSMYATSCIWGHRINSVETLNNWSHPGAGLVSLLGFVLQLWFDHGKHFVWFCSHLFIVCYFPKLTVRHLNPGSIKSKIIFYRSYLEISKVEIIIYLIIKIVAKFFCFLFAFLLFLWYIWSLRRSSGESWRSHSLIFPWLVSD